MTMHIVYLKFHDGHKAGEAAFTERSLARRLCDEGKAIPYPTYLKKKTELAAMVEKEKAVEDPPVVEEKDAEPEGESTEPDKKEKKAPKRKYRRAEKAVTIE